MLDTFVPQENSEPDNPLYWQERLVDEYLLNNGHWPDEPTDRKEL